MHMQLLFEPQVYEARSRDVDIYMKPEVGIYIYIHIHIYIYIYIYSSEPPLIHQHACYYYYPYDYYPTTITTTNLQSFRLGPIVLSGNPVGHGMRVWSYHCEVFGANTELTYQSGASKQV